MRAPGCRFAVLWLVLGRASARGMDQIELDDIEPMHMSDADSGGQSEGARDVDAIAAGHVVVDPGVLA